MSRTRKDGKRGGGHKPPAGTEYWKPRGEPMMSPGRRAKDRTHSMERAERRRIEHDAKYTTEEE